MSTLTPDTAVPAAPTPGLSRTATRSYKAPIAFAVFTVIALVLGRQSGRGSEPPVERPSVGL